MPTVVTAAAAYRPVPQPSYDTFTPRPEPQFRSAPPSPSVACNIETAIREHHDRMQYYRSLSGQDDPADEVASLQSEPERARPTLWQSLARCFWCED